MSTRGSTALDGRLVSRSRRSLRIRNAAHSLPNLRRILSLASDSPRHVDPPSLRDHAFLSLIRDGKRQAATAIWAPGLQDGSGTLGNFRDGRYGLPRLRGRAARRAGPDTPGAGRAGAGRARGEAAPAGRGRGAVPTLASRAVVPAGVPSPSR